jgi:ferredoxin-NADP reductase
MAVPRKLRCRVSRTTDHGDHVYSIELEPETKPPAFRPGQFLHLAIDDYDPSRFWPESRVFSIASPPATVPLRVSYSVRGLYTARMEKELAVGRQVWVKLPYGDFVIDNTKPAVLFAGGTGITAYTTFIADLTPEYPHQVFLTYGARNPGLLIYRDMLEKQASSVPGFWLSLFSEQRAAGMHTGRLSLTPVWPLIEHMSGADCYISGPPEMIKVVSAALRAHGVNSERIRIDAWE